MDHAKKVVEMPDEHSRTVTDDHFVCGVVASPILTKDLCVTETVTAEKSSPEKPLQKPSQSRAQTGGNEQNPTIADNENPGIFPDISVDCLPLQNAEWARVDSNYRPRPYQGRALTN